MKAKTLISFLAVLFLSANIYANGGREMVVFSNIDKNANGCVKEFMRCDKKTNAPLIKNVYHYDAEGRMLQKVIYKWCNKNAWVGIQKFEYTYDLNGNPQCPTVTVWNEKSKEWCSEHNK